MNNNTNNSRIPNLRFPGFEGEWEVKKLGEMANKINKRNNRLEVSRVLTNSANAGVVDQNDYFDRDIAVKDKTENYHIVDTNDFVYNPRISTAAPVGPISINKIGMGIMSPLYTIFRFHTGYIPFYEQYFQTTIWHSYLKGIANFGARFDRMNITSEDFFNMPLLLPSLAEQQKIASFLSGVDSLIAEQDQKVTALKEKKKGLMQQLFPQKVETTPRLRFPGFEGEWKEKKLGEFGQIITGSTPSRQNEKYWGGEFCWVSAQDMKVKYIYDTKEKVTDEGKNQCRILPKNSVLVTCIASIGLNAITKVDCATNQQINAIITKNETIAEFLYQSMENSISKLKVMAGQTAVPIINKQQFSNFSIYVPQSSAEIGKLVGCLSTLDDAITAESDKLEALKTHKKGLMQQLFPQ